MSVLVAYIGASTSTVEVARQVADRLVKAGFPAVVRPLEQVQSLRPYQAVVLGSDVREQSFPPELSQLSSSFYDALAALPAWLFSTGNSGVSVPAALRIREYRHFAGSFPRDRTSALGELFLKVCGAASSDYRDWREINDWAGNIARELQHIDHIKERRRLHLSVRGRP